MGYRSDVIYVVQAPEQIMLAKLAAWRLTDEHTQALEECKIGTHEGVGYVMFSADNVKWYLQYADVICHENLFAAFGADDAFSGTFVRLGENDDDAEYRSFGEEEPLLQITRGVENHVPDFKVLPGTD